MQCLCCGDILVSKHRHDYVACSCNNLSIDGGTSYQRVSCSNPELILDKSVYWTEDNFKEVREVFTWKTYGINQEYPEGKYIKLSEMDTSHIKAIIATQIHIKGTYVEDLLKLELEYRKDSK